MLPTDPTQPKTRLTDFSVLLYGPSKFGKSTLCAEADNALFLATEPGLGALSVYQVPVENWKRFLAACAEIEEGGHPFQTIIVDTVDNLFRMCTDSVCATAGVVHESDLGYGKGYALIYNEFHRALTKLAFLPYGLILVSHSHEKEIETRTGRQVRVVPDLPDRVSRIVLGLVDLILFCDYESVTDSRGKRGVRRIIRTKPTPRYEAGDRTGRLPETIPFDFNALAEAFARSVGSSSGESAESGPEKK